MRITSVSLFCALGAYASSAFGSVPTAGDSERRSAGFALCQIQGEGSEEEAGSQPELDRCFELGALNAHERTAAERADYARLECDELLYGGGVLGVVGVLDYEEAFTGALFGLEVGSSDEFQGGGLGYSGTGPGGGGTAEGFEGLGSIGVRGGGPTLPRVRLEFSNVVAEGVDQSETAAAVAWMAEDAARCWREGDPTEGTFHARMEASYGDYFDDVTLSGLDETPELAECLQFELAVDLYDVFGHPVVVSFDVTFFPSEAR